MVAFRTYLGFMSSPGCLVLYDFETATLASLDFPEATVYEERSRTEIADGHEVGRQCRDLSDDRGFPHAGPRHGHEYRAGTKMLNDPKTTS